VIRRFNRYELKYVIHASTYRAFVDDLRYFMEPDPHGDKDGFYRVISLYYDSPDHQCYRAKVEGLKYRRKLRLRIYPGADMEKVDTGFCEIKQRMNRTVQKRRLTLPLDQAYSLCEGDFDPSHLDDMDQAAASEMLYMVRVANLRPKCMVSYRRQAFMGGRFEQGMRVTFDMQLQGRVHALDVKATANNHYFIPPDWFILEVKVNERIPDWMVSVLAKHQCQTQRVSKYCASLKNGLNRLEYAWRHKENLYG
jgi:hypothetical protein